MAQTRRAAPISLTALARAPQVPWPTASLVAAGAGAIALALILSLPGRSLAFAPPVGAGAHGTTAQRPARQVRADSVPAPAAQAPPAAEHLAGAPNRSPAASSLDAFNEAAGTKSGAESNGAGAAGGREAGKSADESTREAMSQILELKSRRHALETGAARAGGTGPAAYDSESASISGEGAPVAAPAARPSARLRSELAGPVQTRLLARYAALREAGP
jgi:hypothetical protein